MNSIKKISNFYLKPLIVIQLLNLVFFIVLGSYLEEWEGFFSTAIEGIFTKPATRGWDTDTHFLLLYIYSWLANFTSDYNVYGFILIFNNLFSLTFLGCVIFRILRVNLSNSSFLLFIVIYSIVSIDNLVNLNSTRNAFILITAILGYIESRRYQKSSIKKTEWCFLSFFIIYAGLIRFESVFLFSIIYITLLFIHKKFYKLALIPVFISGGILLLFNLTSAQFSSDEKKVLIYKEREIFDRNNVDYERLSILQKLDVDAITEYCITDKEHFNVGFYDSISRTDSENGVFSSLNGFTYVSFLITYITSLKDIYAARYFFYFFWISGLFVLFIKHPDRKKAYNIQFLFLLVFPFLLCLYTTIPLRFLIPFLSVAGCLNVFIFLKHSKETKAILWCSSLLFLLIFSYEFNLKNEYEEKVKKYSDFTNKLFLLDQKYPASEPIVINSVFPINYFPVKPFEKLTKQHAVFLNFYLFSADDYQIQTWKELCHCNTFSLKERVDYVVAHQNLFLIDDDAYGFMENYFSVKYHVQLERTIIKDFDENLRACRLNYGRSVSN